MNLREINEAIAVLAYNRPDCETNVLTVENVGTDIFLRTDTSDLDSRIEDLKTGEANLEEEIKTLEAEALELEAKVTAAEKLLEEFDEGGGAVAVVKRYREEAAREKELRERYAAAMNSAIAERDALRKRKGIEPGIFANARELIDFCYAVAQDAKSPWAKLAANLGQKIRGKK